MSLVPSTETATKVVKALILSEQVVYNDDQRDFNGCLALLVCLGRCHLAL